MKNRRLWVLISIVAALLVVLGGLALLARLLPNGLALEGRGGAVYHRGISR